MATKKHKIDHILEEPDDVEFLVENRPLTPDEERLLHMHMQKNKKEFHAKIKAGKIKIPPYLKKYFPA